MQFSSAVFILLFLPLALLVYFLSPGRRVKNVSLLLLSLGFYAWGDPTYVWLLVLAVLINWLLCLAMEHHARDRGRARLLLALAVVVNLGILGFYKYQGFLAENLSSLTGLSIPSLDLPLPIGISYYTLRLVTYVVDVYRGQAKAQKTPLDLALYAAFFPAMVAGPIVRYASFEPQLTSRRETVPGFVSGARLFAVGLSKKVLLSNVVAILADDMLSLGGARIGLLGSWAGLIAYSMQLYFDFSGYSDMALGISRMLGFDIEKNFNYPYIARSVTEFWRRWHISLSSFFRDYVYIPMGGSRVSSSRLVLNLSVVWVLTGVWHGAAWNYIFWGVFYLLVLLGEKFVWGKLMSVAPKALQHLYVIVVFLLAWALFWISDLGQLREYVLALFGTFGLLGKSTFWELQAWSYLPVLAICVIAATPVVPWLRTNLRSWCAGERVPRHAEGVGPKDVSSSSLCDAEGYLGAGEASTRARAAVWQVATMAADLALLFLMALSVLSLVSGSFSPLIYFKF